MKIIFLDIDGVLNGELLPISGSNLPDIFPELTDRLNQIVQATGAQIVISSAWRNQLSLEEWQGFLSQAGVDAIVIGTTPSFDVFSFREDEIQDYVDKNNIENFVILDDIPMRELKGKAVRTDFNYGLSREDVEKAIQILNNGNKDI